MDKVKSEETRTDVKDQEKLTVEIETDVDKRLQRSKDDERRASRHRFLHTACVCFSMFALGWRNALVGPTFPDLRLIINEDLATASWIFTAISLGGLLGSVSGGMAYDRFNKTLVFAFIMVGLGTVASIAPWCNHFIAMFIIHVLHGGFASALDTAATADVTVIWRHKAGPFMQAIHGSFSVGAIISPFVCESFLAKKLPLPPPSLELNETTNYAVTTQSIRDGYKAVEIEIGVHGDAAEVLDNVTKSSVTMAPELNSMYGQTYIYIPYLIATFVCILAVAFYFILSILFGSVYEKSIISPAIGTNDVHEKKYFLSKKMKIVFTILIALSLATYVISERCFIGFLMTFIITKVGWGKRAGSGASSTFWIAFASGRLSGIFIVKWVKLSIVILVFFSLIALGGVLMWCAVVYSIDLLLWVSIAVIGYGMSVIFASMFSWLSENVRRLTGKMASILFIFLSTGAMLFPILEGHLMDKVSQMWFIYSLLILSVIMIVIFVIAVTLFNIMQKMHESSKSDVKLQSGLL